MLDAIDEQVSILKDVNDTEIGYLGVIENIEEINDEDISNYQVWIIQQKLQYLSSSLNFAKEHMNHWTWEKCYETTIKQLKISGITHATNV